MKYSLAYTAETARLPETTDMKILILLLAVSTGALANDNGIVRCRSLPDAVSRLACYDALPIDRSAPVMSGVATVAAGTEKPADQLAAKKALEQSFGMEYNRKSMLDEIESHIPGKFDGWGPRDKFTLANGQVWMVVDDSQGVVYATDPKVKVTRGALGAIYMEIAGTKKAPRVRRLQ